MRLRLSALKNREQWEDKGYALPRFAVEEMRAATGARPRWLHFGAGNIFRAFPAAALQRLLDAGGAESGLIACECFDGDIIDKAYAPFDELSVLAVLKSDGTVEKRLIASVAMALRADGARPADEETLQSIFANSDLQMVSFTITEKGYAVKGADGAALPFVARDIEDGPEGARSTLGRLAALLYRRFLAGGAPLALVSMDNCSHNGEKLENAVRFIVEGWRDKGFVGADFVAYVLESGRISFPWTMIDKITPRPDASVAEMLRADGFEDAATIVTEKRAYTAAFVNAEEAEYLVIEDDFPNGRPALEQAGLYFTDRETVNKVERMKVCTCLNPLHTALAILGCLLKFPTIHAEMEDADLRELVRRIAYDEGMPVVVDPGILSPKQFASDVLDKRLPNPFMPDTPERIATDTSQKLSIRFGETIKAYLRSPALDVADLRCIPFVFAAWLRYLEGVNDAGEPFAPSPDPLLAELRGLAPETILRRADVFGLDLYEAGLAERTLAWYRQMRGTGAVRKALKDLLK